MYNRNKKLLEFEEHIEKTKSIEDDGNKFTEAENSEIEIPHEDDSGYELDDSGMIPKLEELKAAGKNGEIHTIDDYLFEDTSIENGDVLEYDLDRDFLEEESDEEPSVKNARKEENDFEDFKRLDYDEEYDRDDNIDEVKIFKDSEFDDFEEDTYIDEIDDFEEEYDDLSNLKVNFYDENSSDNTELNYNLNRIAEALERIANALEGND